MGHLDWKELPRWAPVLGCIVSFLKPSDIINFLVSIEYVPDDNWRARYLAIYREIPGLIPWVEECMRFGLTVSLVGRDVCFLREYISNSTKWRLGKKNVMFIWPVCTLPWYGGYENNTLTAMIPHNIINNKFGIIKLGTYNEMEMCVDKDGIRPYIFNAGSIMEPPHSDVVDFGKYCGKPQDTLEGLYVFNNLSGNPNIVLVGGMIIYNGMHTVGNLRRGWMSEYLVDFPGENTSLPGAYIYVCNENRMHMKEELFIPSSHHMWADRANEQLELSRSSGAAISTLYLHEHTPDYFHMKFPATSQSTLRQPREMPREFLDEMTKIYDGFIDPVGIKTPGYTPRQDFIFSPK